jgi:hypothetical protein
MSFAKRRQVQRSMSWSREKWRVEPFEAFSKSSKSRLLALLVMPILHLPIMACLQLQFDLAPLPEEESFSVTRMAMIEKIVEIERILFSIQFPASGSLFFKNTLDPRVRTVDIPKHNSLKDMDRFCVGPSTEYLWWYQMRNELAANRRPCENPTYMTLY